MTALLLQLPLAGNFALFAAFAVAVWLAGTWLSRCADEISDRKRIGQAVMGLVFLALATSLPEVATTFAAAIEQNASLVLGNLFGGISMQTAILAVADLVAVRAALTSYPRKPTPALEAVLLALLLALLLAVGTLGERPLVWHLGVGSAGLALAYVMSIFLLRSYDNGTSWVPVALPEDSSDDTMVLSGDLGALSDGALVAQFIGASLVILICGLGLVHSCEAIAQQSGLGDSFVAVTILASATSLPEVSTTVAAVRLGAYTMALGNIFGSNLIMLVLLLPADLLYVRGPLLGAMDDTAKTALLAGLIMTLVYLAGLLVRHQRKFLGMGVDSGVVLCLYVLSLFAFYALI